MPGILRSKPSAVFSDKDEELLVTAPPEHIRSELDALLDWVNRESLAMWPVAAAAVFFHEFESIHPFEEGNGRTGRVLFHAYLQNAGLANAYRCLVEAELIGDPELYYIILGWTDHSGSYTEIVDYFTAALSRSYEKAVQRFQSKDVSPSLDSIDRMLARAAKQNRTWFSVRDATKFAGEWSEQTIRNRLNRLTEKQLLHSVGRTRARRYRFADPLADVLGNIVPSDGTGSAAGLALSADQGRRQSVGRI